jgi:hypothetical protein
VVSKDELIASIWRGPIVSGSTVAVRINAARRAIGDTGEHQTLIRTLPRKGFRFVGEVRETGSDRASSVTSDQVNDIRFCRTSDGVNIATAARHHLARESSFADLSSELAAERTASGDFVCGCSRPKAELPYIFI